MNTFVGNAGDSGTKVPPLQNPHFRAIVFPDTRGRVSLRSYLTATGGIVGDGFPVPREAKRLPYGIFIENMLEAAG